MACATWSRNQELMNNCFCLRMNMRQARRLFVCILPNDGPYCRCLPALKYTGSPRRQKEQYDVTRARVKFIFKVTLVVLGKKDNNFSLISFCYSRNIE